jgi:hypothetical protein
MHNAAYGAAYSHWRACLQKFPRWLGLHNDNVLSEQCVIQTGAARRSTHLEFRANHLDMLCYRVSLHHVDHPLCSVLTHIQAQAQRVLVIL